jgi:hypothetical protein
MEQDRQDKGREPVAERERAKAEDGWGDSASVPEGIAYAQTAAQRLPTSGLRPAIR